MAAPVKWKTIPAYAAHMATLLPCGPPASRLTKELRSLHSPFTKTRISLPLHCSACWSSLGVTCPVVLNLLPALNEWFLKLAIEVYEIKPGKLALSAVEDDADAMLPCEQGNHAAILLHCLVTRHRCLKVLDNLHVVLRSYPEVFSDALQTGTLDTLRLGNCVLTSDAAQSLMASVRCSEHIVELTLNGFKFYSSTGCNSIQAVEDSVTDIIANSKSLRLLDVDNSSLFHNSAALIKSLEKNGSIENLVVGHSVLTCQQGTIFHRFLSNNTTLRTLTISFSCSCHESPYVDSVFDALLENSTLNVLRFKSVSLNLSAVLLFARLIVCNKTLSEVEFSCCCSDFKCVHETRSDESGELTSICSSDANLVCSSSPAQRLISALKETSSLRRLTLGPVLPEAYNHWLLEAAASCSSLEQLTFNTVYYAQPSFYRELQDAHTSKKVRLGTCYWKAEDFVLALESYGDALAKGSHQFPNLDKMGLHKVVAALPQFDHVTGLDLRLGYGSDCLAEEDASLIASYLASTQALKNVRMRFEVSQELAHLIVEGLCKNTTIEQLSIESWPMQDDDIHTLCSWVATSRKVYNLMYLYNNRHTCSMLVSSLARLLPSCYTLTYFRVVEYAFGTHYWQTVKQLRSRNLSLVECAVSFVLGSTQKRAATAFERMSWHPQVASRAQQVLQLGPEEVSARLQECRRRLQMDFWQIVGVVRHELVCHERVDGQRQIDQLGTDAWLCVRAYLSFDDVLDIPAKRKPRKRKRHNWK